jgi:hypothetical protein
VTDPKSEEAPTVPDDQPNDAPEEEDPMALDPLGPPSGRPW